MYSLNEQTLVGNLGQDAEIFQSNGKSFFKFNVATTLKWKDKQGEVQEKTQWHSIVFFNDGLKDFAELRLKKGTRVFLRGRTEHSNYTDKEGVERTRTQVIGQDIIVL